MSTTPGVNQTIIQPHEKTVWLPTDPPRPCPDILTGDEAAIFLRLGESKRALRTLGYYRASGKLKGLRIGKEIKYRLAELQRFVRDQEAST